MSLFGRKKKIKTDAVKLSQLPGVSDFIILNDKSGKIYHKYTNSHIKRTNEYEVREVADARKIRHLSGNTLVQRI